MKAKELIKILEKHPEAEIYVTHHKRTFVAEGATLMAHTIFLKADKTPFEYNESKKSL